MICLESSLRLGLLLSMVDEDVSSLKDFHVLKLHRDFTDRVTVPGWPLKSLDSRSRSKCWLNWTQNQFGTFDGPTSPRRKHFPVFPEDVREGNSLINPLGLLTSCGHSEVPHPVSTELRLVRLLTWETELRRFMLLMTLFILHTFYFERILVSKIWDRSF